MPSATDAHQIATIATGRIHGMSDGHRRRAVTVAAAVLANGTAI
jgi:hypothetical protein